MSGEHDTTLRMPANTAGHPDNTRSRQEQAQTQTTVKTQPDLTVDVPVMTKPDTITAEVSKQQQSKEEGEKRARVTHRAFSARARDLMTQGRDEAIRRASTLLHLRKQIAARRVQQWWGLRSTSTTRALAKAYKGHGLDRDSVTAIGSAGIETLMAKLQSRQLITDTTKLLTRFALRSGHKVRIHPRMFLSCYVMVAEPELILGTSGPLEDTVLQAAKDLLVVFDTLVADTASTGALPALRYQKLPLLWSSFAKAFQAWKTKDMTELVNTLVRSFVELEQARDHIVDSGESSNPEVWAQEISAKQTSIRKHLTKVVGEAEANRLLSEAMEVVQEAHRIANELKKQQEGTTDDGDGDGDKKSNADGSTSTTTSSTTAAAAVGTPSTSSSSSSASPSTKSTEIEAQAVAEHIERSRLIDQNEQLAHELIMEGRSLQLGGQPNSGEEEVPEGTSAQLPGQALRQVAERAFWAGVRSRLTATPPDLRQIPVLFREVRDSLIALVPNRANIAAAMRADLDDTLLAQQLQHGALDTASFITYLRQVMSKVQMLEAPARDADTQTWLSQTISTIEAAQDPSALAECVISVFRYLFDKVNEIKRDIVNFKLQQLAPFIRSNAVEFERTKVQKHLENGDFTLLRTSQWLYEHMGATATSTLGQSTHTRVRTAFHRGLARLLAIPTAADVLSIPETLRLDAVRINGFQNEFQRVCILATCFSVVNQVLHSYKYKLGDNDRDVMSHKLSVLLAAPGTRVEDITAQIVQEVETLLASASPPRHLQPEHKTLLSQMLSKSIAPSDGIYQLMSTRITDALTTALNRSLTEKSKPAKQSATSSTSKTSEDDNDDDDQDDSTSNPAVSGCDYHASLACVTGEIDRLAARLEPWASYNWAVHEPFYIKVALENE